MALGPIPTAQQDSLLSFVTFCVSWFYVYVYFFPFLSIILFLPGSIVVVNEEKSHLRWFWIPCVAMYIYSIKLSGYGVPYPGIFGQQSSYILHTRHKCNMHLKQEKTDWRFIWRIIHNSIVVILCYHARTAVVAVVVVLSRKYNKTKHNETKCWLGCNTKDTKQSK